MLTLQAPYIGLTDTITLPNPTLGDSVSQSLKTKFGFAMSGKVITTVSLQPEKKLQYTFDKLKRSNVDALLAFLETHASDDIKLTDWQSVIYKVKCITNPLEFTEELHFYSCKIDFQGILV